MNKYKVAAYLRISKEENEQANSITNQREIINSYLKNKNDFELVVYYIDDGYSGTDFNRPEFKRLLVDIKDKKVNVIIVKDLSRFGRNYILVGDYIENIFPILKVRFISINDNFDSSYDSYYMEDIIPLKNMTNDFYSKDISRKVKTALKTKKLNGEFVGKSAPYGYMKHPGDIHKFIVDEEAARIVKKIFDKVLLGKTRREISDELNELKVLTPGLYKMKDNSSNENLSMPISKWNPEMVSRILKNKVYTGVLIQGKTQRMNYRNHKIINVDSKEWIITEKHHEPIISKEQFDKVQNILNKKKGYSSNIDILLGYLKCADCGKSIIIKKSKGHEYYYCSSYVRNSSCTNHLIKKEKLIEEVLNNLNIKYNKSYICIDEKIVDKYIKEIIIYQDKNIEIKYL